jgi:hypothetical protein
VYGTKGEKSFSWRQEEKAPWQSDVNPVDQLQGSSCHPSPHERTFPSASPEMK